MPQRPARTPGPDSRARLCPRAGPTPAGSGRGLFGEYDESLARGGTIGSAIVTRVGADQPETGPAEHPSPLGERELLDAKPPLHGPAAAVGDDELRALAHPGPGIEATVLQDEPLPPRSVPVPPGQRRVVRRIPMVHEETTTGPKRPRHPAQDRLVLAGCEISEAREEGEHGVELRRETESAHVAAHEPQPRAFTEALPRLGQHGAREIHADHAEAPPAELRRVSSVAACHVEDPRAWRHAKAPQQEIHLAPGLQGGLLIAQLGDIGVVEEVREPRLDRRRSGRGAHARALPRSLTARPSPPRKGRLRTGSPDRCGTTCRSVKRS